MLAHGTVDIGFQPVVDLVTQRTVGFEALARGPIGTELESPGALFDAAREAGRLDELDWLCQRNALRDALRAGLRAPSVLFDNVEADASGFLPLDLRGLYAEATAQMVVAVELTERALLRRPASLLGRVADMRALGCTLALDHVGYASEPLAMMAVLSPDVVRLDLAELSARPAGELAEVVDAVAAHAERSGATVLVERVENEVQAELADALGARLGQGWLYGGRERLVTAPAPPAERQVHAAFRRDPRDTTPFQLLSEGCEVRRASRTLLAGLSRHLEEQARAMGRSAVVVGAFEGGEARFDDAARRRYAELAREVAFCGAVGTGMPEEPATGVRGGRIHEADPLAREWTVAVVSPHASVALTASDPGTGGGRYDYALTHDRELAAAATAALMARIAT